MENRWAETISDPLDECVYGSRLLGREPDLVLHGGGNTSVKVTVRDVTGSPVDVLYVKGSGWDLSSIERAGFAPLRLERLRELLTVPSLPDSGMMNELRCALLDASAPDPSVETLLHAVLPHRAVLHSHADAVITLTNLEKPRVEEVFGGRVVVIPYVMPGFKLAQLCAELFPRYVTYNTIGMVLMNHGLFTFGATTQEAYNRHVELVSLAEAHLSRLDFPAAATPPVAPVVLAGLRKQISDVAGSPMIVSRHTDRASMAFVARPDVTSVAAEGPATPDHVIRTKRVPLIGRDVSGYADDYRRYFADHARPGLTMLDPAPRVVLDPELGVLTAGRRAKDADIAFDIYAHTIGIITRADALGGYRALPASDLFDMEYWELEQAKLRLAGAPAEFTGEVALVTGAASGIGRACADALRARGASVIGLDLTPTDSTPDYLGLQVDVTDSQAVADALSVGVERFGGIDMIVASAGVFPGNTPIASLDASAWHHTMSVNASSIATLFAQVHPLLKLSPRGGRVVVVASKNVPAPGPGAAAYSASKAAVTQLARVAALEWAADNIRVNTVHPDAVFDTGLWTPEVLAQRAEHYGLTVAEYKRRNLLGTEVTSAAVGELVATLCSDTFACTTGAQVPIDGGNERVI
ncbi:bifunctional aldolase/short-chain dehydrogenase [Lentzea tibetensis]|uniref:Bifunctional aldolase/short-chain dehydrogenase n=1 Tax=Lentzea tibetensis TaxID=2591470 RepID=A0A563EHK0_9PSEU|nr:bifunctional aldolase/short-chain dehydrogenase [Lentzea tibetensis]TWP46112.1 bifunctional aldolase/short-chain dehydrogenase [Lentzea tibetensis]